MKIVFPEQSHNTDAVKVELYMDASYNSLYEDLRKRKTVSRAGYVLDINNCLVRWYCKKDFFDTTVY